MNRDCGIANTLHRRPIRLLLTTGLLPLVFTSCVRPVPNQLEAPAYEWERSKRVTVADAPRARYPSITKARDGSVVVAYSQQSNAQVQADQGDLVIVRSTDRGATWSRPRAIYRSHHGEPRAIGTMTTLRDGRILLPYSELSQDATTSRVRLLTSDNDGRSWQDADLIASGPLVWWLPCGRIIETVSGLLVMPVFGAESTADLKATIHGCGVLRSRDGGKTWDDFSWITRGAHSVIGADDISRFSFQGLSVQPLPVQDGRPTWLAMVTGRRLNRTADGPTQINEGPGAPQILCRLWSHDKGRTWSKPDQLIPGAWPGLAVAGGDTICANTHWAAWGSMRLLVSRDGFASFNQEVRLTTREWTRGMAARRQEVPLPPTVPYLAKQWPFEHYGFPSCLALDDDHALVVFDRPQRGTGQTDGRDASRIPWDAERIEAVFYERRPIQRPVAPALASKAEPRGRWVLTERMIVGNLSAMTQMPDGDLLAIVNGKISRSSDGGRTWNPVAGARLPDEPMNWYDSALGVLRSGRWLALKTTPNRHAVPPALDQDGAPRGDSHTWVGMRGGYPIMKVRNHFHDMSIQVWYSNDQGKVWLGGRPFKGPFRWVNGMGKGFIEGPLGTISVPVFGCVTKQEVDSYSSSNGVFRSTDGGQTWGDFSYIFRTNPRGPNDLQPEPRYSEMDVMSLANGNWIAFTRREGLIMGPTGWGSAEFALSTDYGHTWQKTGSSLSGVSQHKGIALPDGGIAFTTRATSWQTVGVAISYDEGRSFSYALTGPYETTNAFVTRDDEFVIFTAKSHRSDSLAGVYRWMAK